MISFGAKRINSVDVAKGYSNNNIIKNNVAFVELSPKSKFDLATLAVTSTLWGGHSNSAENLSKNILDEFTKAKNDILLGKKDVNFYALTTQKRNYKYLNPFQILGLVEVASYYHNVSSEFINNIQTAPKFFRGKFGLIGKGMLNCLKKIFETKDLELESTRSAVDFYTRNGFEMLSSENKGLTIPMKYKVIKRLT